MLFKKGQKALSMGKRKDYDLERIYKLSHIELRRTIGNFQMPMLKQEKHFPENLVNFQEAMRRNIFNRYVHFYLDDGKFECLWHNPERYLERLHLFAGVLTPDFSLYTDMPLAMQIWNVFRSRLLGKILQDSGIKVIPTVSWSNDHSFPFCFDGIPKHGLVSVSSVGIWRDKAFLRLFMLGLEAMIEKIEPVGIVFYGKIPEFNFGEITVREYQTTSFQWKNQPKDVHYKENR